MLSRLCLTSHIAARIEASRLCYCCSRFKSSKSGAPSGKNNKSDQMNPNNPTYFKGHGWGSRPDNFKSHTPQSGNNRADQMNPNNPKGGSSPSTEKKK
eukprot:UN11288